MRAFISDVEAKTTRVCVTDIATLRIRSGMDGATDSQTGVENGVGNERGTDY